LFSEKNFSEISDIWKINIYKTNDMMAFLIKNIKVIYNST